MTGKHLIRVFPNQKPWMTSEVWILLKNRKTTFRSGVKALYIAARPELRKGIRNAKLAYERKIEDHFTVNDPRKMWQRTNHITNYRDNSKVAARTDALLAEKLNSFFSRFEAGRSSTDTPHPPPSNISTLTLQELEVRSVLRTMKPRKVPSPDGAPGKVLGKHVPTS